MIKLSLDTESLRVESFSTAGEPTERGTVNANEATRGGETCYCTSREIGCWCTEDVTCAHCD